jgi:serine/threonine protein kinase
VYEEAADLPTLRTRTGASAQQPARELHVGSVVAGRYKLLERLGGGGMGEVFRALDRLAHGQDDPDPYVALKILRPELQQDQTAIKALQREANRALRLTHTNIVRVRQIEQDRETGIHFIVMELLEGRTVLSDIAAHRNGRSWREIAPYLAQICAGLEYAHREGIIHCDIKPSNLFITRRGVVKILDLGIAVPAPGALQGRETWMDARKLGARTPDYASLEVFLGHEAHYSDDVYSLACVIHEWLSGSHPYLSREAPRRALAAPEALALGIRPVRLRGLTRAQARGLRKALNLARAGRTPTIGELWRGVAVARPAWSAARIAAGAAGTLIAGGALLAGLGILPVPPAERPPLPLVLTARPDATSRALPEPSAPAPLADEAGTSTPDPAVQVRPAAVAATPGSARSRSPATPTADAPLARSRMQDGPVHPSPASQRPTPRWAGQSLAEDAASGHEAASRLLGLEAYRGEDRPGGEPVEVLRQTEAAHQGGDARPDVAPMRGDMPRDEMAKVASVMQAARQGDARAQYQLGVLYQEGQGGVPRSQLTAASWFALSAAQGNPQAESILGFLYQTGRGVPQSDAQAVHWLTRAASQGDAEAQARLGFLYATGQAGLQQNEPEAARWLGAAAQQGNPSGQYNLAVMYEKGRGGLPRSDAQAVRWLVRAASRGNEDARRSLRARGLGW